MFHKACPNNVSPLKNSTFFESTEAATGGVL